ncbi:hypothetical protein LPJ56_000116 [Coemansia sp. RSA 2599]|nr:hypothetical protein LPJ56_000116 [Coemansia sp. RSA 2599]
MAKDSTTEANDALSTTPLSVSFHDPSFTSFVNEVNVRTDTRYTSRSKHQRNQQGSDQGLPSKARAPQSALSQNASIESFSGAHSTSNQTQMAAKAASVCSNAIDDDFDDFGDDFNDINPQEILDMVLQEEKLFATQQFMASTEVSLSQEDAEARHEETMLNNAHGVPVLTRSVPVTPSRTEPIYISDSDTPGRVSADELAGASLANKTTPSALSGMHQLPTPSGRGNLYPRLARHIPQSRPVSGTPGVQPRPPPPIHSLASHSDSSSRPLASRQQPPAKQVSDYRHHRYRPPPLGPLSIDLNSSSLLLPSAMRHSPYSPRQPASARGEAGTVDTPISGSNNIAEELERLKMENARIRAESEQLRAQLYTKEGEVKIVRENLARTEIDNTHLQERLANQIASSTLLHKELETKLREEIERLRTELAFQQQEVQAAVMVKTPVSSRSMLGTQKTASRSAKAHSVASPNPAGSNTRSLASTYPSIEDFVATPTAAGTSRPPKAAEPAKAMAMSSEEPARDEGAKTENAELLRILTDIASQPSNAGFGFLVSVSVALSRAVRRPSNEGLDSFHKLVCASLLDTDIDSANHEQSAAVLQLLLRATDALPEFRSAWLLSAPKDQPKRADQVVLAASAALRRNVMFASRIAAGDREAETCGSVIRLQCKLLLSIIGLPSMLDMINEKTWPDINPFVLGSCFTQGLHMDALQGILDLAAVLVKESGFVWTFLRQKPDEYEMFLLASVTRLRLAFSLDDRLMIDGEHGFLVLVATTMMGPEDASAALINRMKAFARTMVVWFLEEHQTLTSSRQHSTADMQRRIQVFRQYVICLKVVLSEISDVVELLDGDFSPTFFAFVAACTRMTVGESAFAGDPSIRELAADLLAYAVTEEQALSIQNL